MASAPKAPRWTKADAAKLSQVATNTVANIFPRANPDDYKALAHFGHVEFNMGDVDPAQPGLFPIRATAQGIQESGVSSDAAIDTNADDANISDVNNGPEAPTENANMSDTTLDNTVADTGAPAPAAVAAATRQRLAISADDIKIGMVSGLPEKPKGATRGRKSAYPFGTLVAPKVVSENETHYSRFFLPNKDGREDMKKLVQGNVTAYNGKVKDVIDPATGKPAKFEAFDVEVEENGQSVKGVAVYRVQ